MESRETLELKIRTTERSRPSLVSSASSDDENSFVGIPFRMPSTEQKEGVADLDDLIKDDNNEQCEGGDEDVNNGAILVHGSSSGKPDLDLFMETLEGAMVKCEDPEYMAKVSARYKESRMSKMIQPPPLMQSNSSYRLSTRNDSSETLSIRGSIPV